MENAAAFLAAPRPPFRVAAIFICRCPATICTASNHCRPLISPSISDGNLSPCRPHQSVLDGRPCKSPSSRQLVMAVPVVLSLQPLQAPSEMLYVFLGTMVRLLPSDLNGINIILSADEHCLGRLVEDVRFQIDSNSVSANHCRIYRMKVTNENMENATSILLKDTSTNGTYLNWEKLKKNGAAVKVCHGDIISFAAPPQHDLAFAFVYRDVLVSSPVPDNAVVKRKAEDFISENKRLKGLGIGAPEGPISLDDFRSLQRSNTELRKQLENQVVTIDTLRSDNRTAVERHESSVYLYEGQWAGQTHLLEPEETQEPALEEIKSVKESVAKCYLDQLKELQQTVDLKQKELGDLNKACAEQRHALEDLNERLSASTQSCAEANSIISSQKVNIAELKEQLDDERTQRKEEREKAAADLKAAVHKAQSEAEEELKRLSDAALRRERELQEAINKLQESEREMSLLAETLRSKLEDTRQKLVVSDNKVRQLETLVHEEKLAAENEVKKVEHEQQETRRLRKELESEKAAREEAWAKVSVLELEINAAMRDLDFERRRLKGARERLMLREHSINKFFYCNSEVAIMLAEYQRIFVSSQGSYKMDNVCKRTFNVDTGVHKYYVKSMLTVMLWETQLRSFYSTTEEIQVLEKDDGYHSQNDAKTGSEECQNTQEAEFTSAAHEHSVRGGYGYKIDGIGTDNVLEKDTAVGTEKVLETESPINQGEQNIDLNKCLGGDTMQIDDDDNNVQETEELAHIPSREGLHHHQSNNPLDTQKTIDDTEVEGTITTADLLTSEVAGSWACSTAPSMHEENESLRSRDTNEGSGALHDSNVVVAESQTTLSDAAVARQNARRELSEMIGIVAPDLREQFGGSAYDCDQERKDGGCSSDSDTESCSNTSMDNVADAKGGSISDDETQVSYHDEEDKKQGDTMDEDDEDTQED
ncbi:uncharacterized protein HKW66_Vig0113550 [Vigna angularis]|uniref:FHA domain-containing protein n=1 Tax=Phaseolus angularis TaxID=3914 RepID=A0A8T0L202_PHAAN|nr:uncharacterized protein HKW66_Vig0113550 [Vigna angularis]